MRRNSKPTIRPARTSRWTPSIAPPRGAVQLSSLSTPPFAPPQVPAIQASDPTSWADAAGTNNSNGNRKRIETSSVESRRDASACLGRIRHGRSWQPADLRARQQVAALRRRQRQTEEGGEG